MDVNRLVTVLFGWLPFPGKRSRQRLLKHDGIKQISAKESVEEVFSVDTIFDKDCILLPGHLVRVDLCFLALHMEHLMVPAW